MAKKGSNTIHRQIGIRLRMRRLMLDISQEKVAAGLGVTFQEVQKCEKGYDRISAGRL